MCVGGGQGGYERRIKVFVKIKRRKQCGGGGVGLVGGPVGGGVRVDVNEELKFFQNSKNKKLGRGLGRGGG